MQLYSGGPFLWNLWSLRRRYFNNLDDDDVDNVIICIRRSHVHFKPCSERPTQLNSIQLNSTQPVLKMFRTPQTERFQLSWVELSRAGRFQQGFKRLQSMQNTAARLVSGVRRRDYITPVLTTLEWLQSINQSINQFISIRQVARPIHIKRKESTHNSVQNYHRQTRKERN